MWNIKSALAEFDRGNENASIEEELVRTKKKLDFVLNHDASLGTFNMRYGAGQVVALIRSHQIKNYAIVFFNLCNMGGVNALLGHDKGDEAMALFIKKLSSVIEDPELFWRLGGDNFAGAVLQEHLESVLSIMRGCTVSVEGGDGAASDERIPDLSVAMSASCGIYRCSEKDMGIDDMFNGAMNSLNIARFSKHVPFVYFDEKTRRMMEHIKDVERSFEKAIKDGEFTPYYQPKVSLDNRELAGAEILCRWIKDGQVVPPDSFIPVLERSSKICTLDFYMLNRLCADIRRWMDSGVAPVPVSTNFSRKHLVNPNLADDIVNVIDSYRVPHDLIVIELTETTTESDMQRLKKLVFDLKEKGIKTSVDDFGVGYSSMSLILDVPFNELKIDKSFLSYYAGNAPFPESENRKNIMMKHVITMAQELGMTCIAEGVETNEQVKSLKDMQCYRAQGFFFDKPLPLADFEEKLSSRFYTDRNS